MKIKDSIQELIKDWSEVSEMYWTGRKARFENYSYTYSPNGGAEVYYNTKQIGAVKDNWGYVAYYHSGNIKAKLTENFKNDQFALAIAFVIATHEATIGKLKNQTEKMRYAKSIERKIDKSFLTAKEY